MTARSLLDRRAVLQGGAAVGIAGALPARSFAQLQPHASHLVVSVTDFGARTDAGFDSTRAIQAAIAAVGRNGGGIVLVPGRFRCGKLVISGHNVRLQGRGGWLVDARVTIAPEASNAGISDLGIVDTTGDKRSYLLDVSGRNCLFTNVELLKEPAAAGYMVYLRQKSSGCRFDGLRLRGSNGIMVAGSDHLFQNFDLQAKVPGGDDAFAIKGLNATTDKVVIRNGTVRDFAAIVSIGSEIGSSGGRGPAGAVRDVTVENVTGARCTRVAFIKPGAIVADWRNGLVDGVLLRTLKLSDPTGERFRCGLELVAARGATVRNVRASGIEILARARDSGVVHTAAVKLMLMNKGAPATIEDVDLQVKFTDPYAGVPHGAHAPGYPVDHIAWFGRINSAKGSMSGIAVDLEGRGTGFGGIVVGSGLDDAITVRRAILQSVGVSPRSSVGGGGIWSNSRLKLGEVQVDSVKLPAFGGSAFRKPRT